jgi:hypothetical protein
MRFGITTWNFGEMVTVSITDTSSIGEAYDEHANDDVVVGQEGETGVRANGWRMTSAGCGWSLSQH